MDDKYLQSADSAKNNALSDEIPVQQQQGQWMLLQYLKGRYKYLKDQIDQSENVKDKEAQKKKLLGMIDFIKNLSRKLHSLFNHNAVAQCHTQQFLSRITNLPLGNIIERLQTEIQLQSTRTSPYFRLMTLIEERKRLLLQLKSRVQTRQYGRNEVNLDSSCKLLAQLRLKTLMVIQALMSWKKYMKNIDKKSQKSQPIRPFEYEDSRYLESLKTDTKFLTDSSLGKIIKFSDGFDPLFLHPYKLLIRSDKSQMEKYGCIIQLFDLNFDFAFRLNQAHKTIQKQLQHQNLAIFNKNKLKDRHDLQKQVFQGQLEKSQYESIHEDTRKPENQVQLNKLRTVSQKTPIHARKISVNDSRYDSQQDNWRQKQQQFVLNRRRMYQQSADLNYVPRRQNVRLEPMSKMQKNTIKYDGLQRNASQRYRTQGNQYLKRRQELFEVINQHHSNSVYDPYQQRQYSYRQLEPVRFVPRNNSKNRHYDGSPRHEIYREQEPIQEITSSQQYPRRQRKYNERIRQSDEDGKLKEDRRKSLKKRIQSSQEKQKKRKRRNEESSEESQESDETSQEKLKIKRKQSPQKKRKKRRKQRVSTESEEERPKKSKKKKQRSSSEEHEKSYRIKKERKSDKYIQVTDLNEYQSRPHVPVVQPYSQHSVMQQPMQPIQHQYQGQMSNMQPGYYGMASQNSIPANGVMGQSKIQQTSQPPIHQTHNTAPQDQYTSQHVGPQVQHTLPPAHHMAPIQQHTHQQHAPQIQHTIPPIQQHAQHTAPPSLPQISQAKPSPIRNKIHYNMPQYIGRPQNQSRGYANQQKLPKQNRLEIPKIYKTKENYQNNQSIDQKRRKLFSKPYEDEKSDRQSDRNNHKKQPQERQQNRNRDQNYQKTPKNSYDRQDYRQKPEDEQNPRSHKQFDNHQRHNKQSYQNEDTPSYQPKHQNEGRRPSKYDEPNQKNPRNQYEKTTKQHNSIRHQSHDEPRKHSNQQKYYQQPRQNKPQFQQRNQYKTNESHQPNRRQEPRTQQSDQPRYKKQDTYRQKPLRQAQNQHSQSVRKPIREQKRFEQQTQQPRRLPSYGQGQSQYREFKKPQKGYPEYNQPLNKKPQQPYTRQLKRPEERRPQYKQPQLKQYRQPYSKKLRQPQYRQPYNQQPQPYNQQQARQPQSQRTKQPQEGRQQRSSPYRQPQSRQPQARPQFQQAYQGRQQSRQPQSRPEIRQSQRQQIREQTRQPNSRPEVREPLPQQPNTRQSRQPQPRESQSRQPEMQSRNPQTNQPQPRQPRQPQTTQLEARQPQTNQQIQRKQSQQQQPLRLQRQESKLQQSSQRRQQPPIKRQESQRRQPLRQQFQQPKRQQPPNQRQQSPLQQPKRQQSPHQQPRRQDSKQSSQQRKQYPQQQRQQSLQKKPSQNSSQLKKPTQQSKINRKLEAKIVQPKIPQEQFGQLLKKHIDYTLLEFLAQSKASLQQILRRHFNIVQIHIDQNPCGLAICSTDRVTNTIKIQHFLYKNQNFIFDMIRVLTNFIFSKDPCDNITLDLYQVKQSQSLDKLYKVISKIGFYLKNSIPLPSKRLKHIYTLKRTKQFQDEPFDGYTHGIQFMNSALTYVPSNQKQLQSDQIHPFSQKQYNSQMMLFQLFRTQNKQRQLAIKNDTRNQKLLKQVNEYREVPKIVKQLFKNYQMKTLQQINGHLEEEGLDTYASSRKIENVCAVRFKLQFDFQQDFQISDNYFTFVLQEKTGKFYQFNETKLLILNTKENMKIILMADDSKKLQASSLKQTVRHHYDQIVAGKGLVKNARIGLHFLQKQLYGQVYQLGDQMQVFGNFQLTILWRDYLDGVVQRKFDKSQQKLFHEQALIGIFYEHNKQLVCAMQAHINKEDLLFL